MNQERNKEHKNRIAFCIPTKNRYLCMKELLEYLEDKKDICPMDIFIYDSSDDDKTKELARKFEYHGGEMTYIDMGDYQGNIDNQYGIRFSMKLYQIYKDFVGVDKYDYVWLSGDGVRFCNEILERIYYMQKSYAMITIVDKICNNYNEEMYEIKEKEYMSAETYIKYNTVANSLSGAILINTGILKKLDWKEVYLWCSDEKLCSYVHIKLYSELACKVDNFEAIVLNYDNAITTSVFKTDVGWRKHFLQVTVDGWRNIIEDLNVTTGTKEYIWNYICTNIKIDKDFLLRLRVWNVYNKECFEKYEDYITNCVTETEAKEILDTPIEELNAWYEASKKRLDTLCRKHSKILIYGAGLYAKIWYSVLYNLNIKVAGFIVSDKDKNPSELLELPVRTFDEIKNDLNDTGIVIGISKEKATGIKERLLQYIDEDAVFFEEDWRMVAY